MFILHVPMSKVDQPIVIGSAAQRAKGVGRDIIITLRVGDYEWHSWLFRYM